MSVETYDGNGWKPAEPLEPTYWTWTKAIVVAVASVCFVATVYFANWLIERYGPIRVWPTDLLAPAGVYVVGLAFLLKDTVQRFTGIVWPLLLIALGTGLTWLFVDARLAGASAAAFAVSEILAVAVFLAAGGQTGGVGAVAIAVACASLVGAAVDSLTFLWIAFGWDAGVRPFFEGQFVAKISVLVLAIPFVLLARKRYPTTAAAHA